MYKVMGFFPHFPTHNRKIFSFFSIIWQCMIYSCFSQYFSLKSLLHYMLLHVCCKIPCSDPHQLISTREITVHAYVPVLSLDTWLSENVISISLNWNNSTLCKSVVDSIIHTRDASSPWHCIRSFYNRNWPCGLILPPVWDKFKVTPVA